MRAVLTMTALLLVACPTAPSDSAPGESPKGSVPDASAAPLAGELHVGGRRVRVTPFIFHPYEMDLRVRGLIDRDRARKEGDPAPILAFDEDRRSAPPTTFRVEYRMGLRVSDSMRLLAMKREAAHFLIEPTGSIYQVLDTEHVARRQGELRPAEIRILSGNTGGTNTLIAALTTHYGALTTQQHELKLPPTAPAQREPCTPWEPPMIRPALLLLALSSSLALVMACAEPPEASCETTVAVGEALPAATVQACDGSDESLQDLISANDVTYITFGAGWCVACAEEIPLLNDLAATFAGQKVAIVQILMEGTLNGEPFDSQENAFLFCDGWSQTYKAEFPVLIDSNQSMLCDHFGEAVGTLPVHLLVTGEGTVRLRLVGALPEDMEERIDAWL